MEVKIPPATGDLVATATLAYCTDADGQRQGAMGRARVALNHADQEGRWEHRWIDDPGHCEWGG